MSTHLDFAIHLARHVGALLKTNFKLSGTAASFKADHSYVTEVDIAADHLITQAIQSQYPQDTILSEELHHRLDTPSPVIWIVDPLDGTTNYSLGLHIWGVLIARVVQGVPDLTAMYFPLVDELYSAEAGSGAYLNGERIQVRPPGPENRMSFFACCSRTYQRFDVRIPYKPRILGSAAYSYCMLARGAALLALEVTPRIWDIAGIWLLVQEAGGVIEPLEGQAPFPLGGDKDYTHIKYPALAAASPQILSAARSQIFKK